MAAVTKTNPTGSDIVAAAETRFFDPQHPWTYWLGGNGGTTYDWIPDATTGAVVKSGPGIDCSHFVQQAMLASGYDVDYWTSGEMTAWFHDPDKASSIYDYKAVANNACEGQV